MDKDYWRRMVYLLFDVDAHKRGVLTGIINGSNEVITSGGDCGMKVWKII